MMKITRVTTMLLLASTISLPTQQAIADETCSLSTGMVTGTVDGSASLRADASGQLYLDSLYCGGNTTAIDSIQLTGSSGNDELRFDLSASPLAPGTSSETDGSPEI